MKRALGRLRARRAGILRGGKKLRAAAVRRGISKCPARNLPRAGGKPMRALLLIIRTECPALPAAKKSSPPSWLQTASGERVELAGRCALGRAAENDLVIPAPPVSRRHALIALRDSGGYHLTDLGSRNGTRLNGRRITSPVRLHDGDRVGIGPVILIFRTSALSRKLHEIL
jgi:hypothetical protein